jgi:preprotein translocase subunit YajC
VEGGLLSLLPLLAILALLYFLLILPQQRRRRQLMELQRQLTPGQQIMTHAGLFATVSAVEDDKVVLEVAPGVKVRYAKAAVARVVGTSEEGESSTEESSSAD